MADKILRFMGNPNTSHQKFTSLDLSYFQAASLQKWRGFESHTNPEDRNSKILSSCLVGAFNDSFCSDPQPEVLQTWFSSRWKVMVGMRVKPLTHNLFLFELPLRQEAERVKFSDWFWNRRRLSLDFRSLTMGTKIFENILGQKWVRAFGIPLHGWSEKILKFTGNCCGGYIDIDVDTKNRNNLLWARICIKDSNQDPPSKIDLVVEDLVFVISIIPDGHCSIAAAGTSSQSLSIDLWSKEMAASRPTPSILKFVSQSRPGLTKKLANSKVNKSANFTNPLVMDDKYYNNYKQGKRAKVISKGKEIMKWRAKSFGSAQSLFNS